MKIISHRANISGIDIERENNPYYIDQCITMGFDVEIDLRIVNNKLYLGHDYAKYEINADWLDKRKHFLLVHIKEIEALYYVLEEKLDLVYFCHTNDDFTPISNGSIWCHDLKTKRNNKCIIPLLSSEQIDMFNQFDMYAICSDYIYKAKNKFSI
jgi:hypothetical protein